MPTAVEAGGGGTVTPLIFHTGVVVVVVADVSGFCWAFALANIERIAIWACCVTRATPSSAAWAWTGMLLAVVANADAAESGGAGVWGWLAEAARELCWLGDRVADCCCCWLSLVSWAW